MSRAIMTQAPGPRAWAVAELVQMTADLLQSRLNPVRVRGELAGLTVARSGHCYFSLKDPDSAGLAPAQLRCVMFARAASLLAFPLREGQVLELQGRLDIYAPRGDLQMVVETAQTLGQGALLEQFLWLKQKLQAAGFFDAARKRPIPAMPRGIAVVTSLQAAALHDVCTALQRRAPHVPVWIVPASVQGVQAPTELARALAQAGALPQVDVVLLVRGGGSVEDLAAFNSEQLARAIVNSAKPVVCGVGHETDFSIADFCADLRAPTPTAAAELCAAERVSCLQQLDALARRLSQALQGQLDQQQQGLDRMAAHWARFSGRVSLQNLHLTHLEQGLRRALQGQIDKQHAGMMQKHQDWCGAWQAKLLGQQRHLQQLSDALTFLSPQGVLDRGYAWVSNAQGQAIEGSETLQLGEQVHVQWAKSHAKARITGIG